MKWIFWLIIFLLLIAYVKSPSSLNSVLGSDGLISDVVGGVSAVIDGDDNVGGEVSDGVVDESSMVNLGRPIRVEQFDCALDTDCLSVSGCESGVCVCDGGECWL